MNSQREYREWRAEIEKVHGYAGVTFSMMIQSGKVVGAEAFSGLECLGKWPPSKAHPNQIPNINERGRE